MNARDIKRQLAFTLIELLVIIVVVVMLIVLVFSGMRRAKEEAQRKQCVNNLKQVGLAFRQWTLPSGDQYPAQVPTINGGAQEPSANGSVFVSFQVMSNQLHDPKILVCPADNRTSPRSFVGGWGNMNLSYFVGIDAHETYPQMLLSGDHNITNGVLPPNRVLSFTANSPVGYTHELHKRRGNVCFADGSVQSANDDAILRRMISNSGSVTNRLAMP